MPHLAAVIPVYGCADCLRPLHERLTASLREREPLREVERALHR
jgi:hypothetical protein